MSDRYLTVLWAGSWLLLVVGFAAWRKWDRWLLTRRLLGRKRARRGYIYGKGAP